MNNDKTYAIQDLIKATVTKSITNYIEKQSQKKPKFQILDLIIPVERKIRSIVGGMETSLGTTLWEPLAKNLALRNGFEVINQNLEKPANMPANLNNTIQLIVSERTNKNSKYTAAFCHEEIKNICQSYINRPINDFLDAPKGAGVDIWLKKDGVNYFFDTKTVQPNVRDYSSYFQQIIHWYAYFYSKYPNQYAQARIVFPYNPHENKCFWDETTNKGWPLERANEAWVENEFWDFCSGENNTYEIIKASFESIAKDGSLREKLKNIFYNQNNNF
jgi:hypothetical protein